MFSFRFHSMFFLSRYHANILLLFMIPNELEAVLTWLL